MRPDLVNRLRGIYTVPINDGAGPLNGSDTFTRAFPVPPINGEAADEIERLRREVERLNGAADGWQPIETAPRDGTNFLACSPASSVFLAHYANGVVDSSDWSDDDGYRERHATHWMPLPAPPVG